MHHFFGQYRNLYKFSQQGWEHMNKRDNGAYRRHSQKSGKKSGSSTVTDCLQKQSHLFPAFRLFVQFWMGKTRKGEEYFSCQN